MQSLLRAYKLPEALHSRWGKRFLRVEKVLSPAVKWFLRVEKVLCTAVNGFLICFPEFKTVAFIDLQV
jgi:hypothetical protein